MSEKLLSIQCRMWAVIARIEGMKSFNAQRACNGQSVGYTNEHFSEAESELLALAEEADRTVPKTEKEDEKEGDK